MSKVSGYGGRSQVTGLIRSLDDALGNKDGIPKNEAKPSGWTPKHGLVGRQALLNKFATAFEPGTSTKDEEQRLTQFVAAKEKAWGTPVTALNTNAVKHFSAFQAEKAIALTRFGRTPSEVTEGMLKAKGTVNGERLPEREVFWQRWKPVGKPSGKVVVVSPGFQETGRNFYEQIDLLNRNGDEVVVMDHPWAGYSEGNPGEVDRGFTVMLNVAAVTAMVQKMADDEFGKTPHRVVLLGNSMGAGRGVFGALMMNAANKLQLDGPQMRKDLAYVLQAPYVEMTDSLLNLTLEALSHSVVKDAELPATGMPVLTHDAAAAAKFANHVAIENIKARPQAMSSTNEDMAVVMKLFDEGVRPGGRGYIIQSDQDPLASPKATKALAKKLGAQVFLKMLSSKNHILEESPSEQRHVLEAMRWLDGE